MLKLSENNKNLGNLRVNQPKSFSITLINSTNKDIEITKIHPGCGRCTRARVDSNFVRANSSLPLNIVFTPDSTGINRKTITINEKLIFSFNAQVIN